MSASFATVGTWSYGLAAAGFAAFLVLLAAWRRRPAAPWLLLAALVAAAAWAGAGVLLAATGEVAWWSAQLFLDFLRTGLWLALLATFFDAPGADAPAAWRWLRRARWGLAAAALGLAALVSAFPPNLSGLAMPASAHGQWGLGALLGVTILGLAVIEHLLRNAPENARWRLKPVLIGLGSAFAFDLVVFAEAFLFRAIDADLWAARGAVSLFVLPFVALTLARTREWKSPAVTVSRGVVFHSVALVGCGVYLLAVAAAGYYVRYFGGSWGKTVQAVFVFGALVVLALVVLSGTVRSRLRVFVAKHFFAYRYDYRQEWLRFTARLSSPDRDLTLQQQCIQALADLVESTGGLLWLRGGSVFAPAARWNMPETTAAEPADSAFASFLAESGWIADVAEWRSAPERYGGRPLPEWLRQLDAAWLVVPLGLASELLGFVILARPRTPFEINWEVRDLLKTASRQAASYLAQLQASEALLEARKFDAFNRMSAFVVHDLKNLIAQLSLMLRNAERHRDKPEFQRDMLLTVENVVQRMNQLLLQLRSGTTPVDKPASVALEPILRRVQRARVVQRPQLAVETIPGISALGHEDRLERVVGHLVQNALDATPPDGRVAVRTYREGGTAVIEVTDEGVGMTAEFVRNKLFRPFQSTKPGGMGIGAYESAQYVRDLGGRIEVDSQPGRGTRIRLILPERSAESAGEANREAA
jgi:putative PEP-CTERM system histidine kinase